MTKPVPLSRKPYTAAALVEALLIKPSTALKPNALRNSAAREWQRFDLSITVYSVHRTNMLLFASIGQEQSTQPLDRYRFPLLAWTAVADETAKAFDELRFDFSTGALRDVRDLSFDFQWTRSSNQPLLRFVAVPAVLGD